MGPNSVLGISLGVLALVLPRRLAFGAVLASVIYTTYGDALDLGGLSFFSIRIVIIFTLVRVIARSELKGVRLHPFDALIAAWLLATNVMYVVLDGSFVNFSERLGYLGDVGGLYVIVRAFVRNVDDLAEIVLILALLLIPLAVLMGFERATGRNLFSVLGGVPEWSQLRNGKVRCQGPFNHPIVNAGVKMHRLAGVKMPHG